MSATQDPVRDAGVFACVHEAAHAIVGIHFGQAVESIRVDGELGCVLFEQAPRPKEGLVRVHWEELCCSVAGEVGEFLYAEFEDGDGRWRSPEERAEVTSSSEALMEALSVPANSYPAGAVGLFLRYVAALTGHDSLVTAQLWRSRTGGSPDAAAVVPVGECDVAGALRHSGWVLCCGGSACLPCLSDLSSEIDGDGLDAQFHLIHRAELEAETLLKGQWHRVCAVARSLDRRKNHRMMGRQLAALLRASGSRTV